MKDEIPIFAIVALAAEGTMTVRYARELKVKESNRIATFSAELGKIGAGITETDDDMIIPGKQHMHSAVTDSHLDHRLVMT